MRISFCSFLFLFLTHSAARGQDNYNNFLNSINISGERECWCDAELFKIHYYERKKDIHDIFWNNVSSLYVSYTPPVGNTVLNIPGTYSWLKELKFDLDNCYIQDTKTKDIYHSRYIEGNSGLIVKREYDLESNYYFANQAGPVYFRIDFDLLPKDVEEVDVFLGSKRMFKGIKINFRKNKSKKLETLLDDYRYGHIMFVYDTSVSSYKYRAEIQIGESEWKSLSDPISIMKYQELFNEENEPYLVNGKPAAAFIIFYPKEYIGQTIRFKVRKFIDGKWQYFSLDLNVYGKPTLQYLHK